MKQWYMFYYRELEKLPQLVGELQGVENKSDIKLHQLGGELAEDKLHQLGGEIKDEEGIGFPVFFALVPWKHHVEIVRFSDKGE